MRSQIEEAERFITEKFVSRLKGAEHKVWPSNHQVTSWLEQSLMKPRSKQQQGATVLALVTPRILPELQIEVVRFQTDAESVAEALCARAKDLNTVALVMARCPGVHPSGTLYCLLP